MSDWSAHVIICDDVRQETSGKWIIIGAYSGEIVLFISPFTLGIATYTQISGLSEGDHKVRLKVRFEDGHHVAEIGDITVDFNVNRPDLPTVLVPGALPFYTDRNGALIVSLGLDGGEMRDVSITKVTHPVKQ